MCTRVTSCHVHRFQGDIINLKEVPFFTKNSIQLNFVDPLRLVRENRSFEIALRTSSLCFFDNIFQLLEELNYSLGRNKESSTESSINQKLNSGKRCPLQIFFGKIKQTLKHVTLLIKFFYDKCCIDDVRYKYVFLNEI